VLQTVIATPPDTPSACCGVRYSDTPVFLFYPTLVSIFPSYLSPWVNEKSIKVFFKGLGVMQIFCRPHTPDNAEMESFFATLKCERLYRGSYGEGQALQAETNIAVFIEYYPAPEVKIRVTLTL
jgi:hypothetical protein